ncbi:hypothetical protein [Siphonobacter aquaeclarae]|uniref:hypothetical protein n=1 Tax=Siphonobacter aquaeclarae TaxID=563176 RepID=UPI000B83A5B8|nr:hypothetical protein [Siphonobacter aquaeclarae]
MCRYLLLCFLTLEAAAQTGRISGTLQDSLTGSPLRLATVSLHTSTGRTDGTFADSLGCLYSKRYRQGRLPYRLPGIVRKLGVYSRGRTGRPESYACRRLHRHWQL